jgi:hypothetical protein
LSAASRAVASITENTIAPLMQRLSKTVARKSQSTATRRQRGMSLDEIARQRGQDEQDMFDSQMLDVPRD